MFTENSEKKNFASLVNSKLKLCRFHEISCQMADFTDSVVLGIQRNIKKLFLHVLYNTLIRDACKLLNNLMTDLRTVKYV